MDKMCVLVDDIEVFNNCTAFTINGITYTCRHPIKHKDIMYLDVHDDEVRKKERDKLWAMFTHIAKSEAFGGMRCEEIIDAFGTVAAQEVYQMPVEDVIKNYESWLEDKNALKRMRKVKIQDVLYFPKFDDAIMVTRIDRNEFDDGHSEHWAKGIDGDGNSKCYKLTGPMHSKWKRIGRIVIAADILREIEDLKKNAKKLAEEKRKE